MEELVDQKSMINLFKRTQAMLEGHFILTSGMHSKTYMQCARVLSYPEYASSLGASLAMKFKSSEIDFVISPALGGVIIAHEVARALGKPAIFCERVKDQFELRRGFEIYPAQRALIIEDVVTTGGSLLETAKLVKENRGKIVGFGSVVDRSSENPFPEMRYESLMKISLDIFHPKDCPLCKDGLPAIKPGSRKG